MSGFRGAIASFAITSLSILSSITAYANPTPSPSASATHAPRPHPISTHSKAPLTQSQRDAIAEANMAFASTRANALAGFARAVADAQAIRDQAILAGGKDKSAIKTAKENFRDFYKTISDAYKTTLMTAKLTRLKALAAAHAPADTK